MTTPITTFRGVRRTPALVDDIAQRFDKLGRYAPRIVGGRVLVTRAERRHRGATHYLVRVLVSLPGEDVVVEHDSGARPAPAKPAGAPGNRVDAAEEAVALAIRRAFEAARRRLQDRVRKQRGD